MNKQGKCNGKPREFRQQIIDVSTGEIFRNLKDAKRGGRVLKQVSRTKINDEWRDKLIVRTTIEVIVVGEQLELF